MVKKFQHTLDKRGELYQLIEEHLSATNMLKDYNDIIIYNNIYNKISNIIRSIVNNILKEIISTISTITMIFLKIYYNFGRFSQK